MDITRLFDLVSALDPNNTIIRRLWCIYVSKESCGTLSVNYCNALSGARARASFVWWLFTILTEHANCKDQRSSILHKIHSVGYSWKTENELQHVFMSVTTPHIFNANSYNQNQSWHGLHQSTRRRIIHTLTLLHSEWPCILSAIELNASLN